MKKNIYITLLESEKCVRMEEHVHPWTVVSVS